MSLFRKPKKNIVQRRVFTENDEEDEEDQMEVQEIVKEQKAKKKEKTSKNKQKLLSFEVEEEGEVFQVRKSSHQKRVMRMFEKEKRKKDKDKEKCGPKEDQNKVTLDEDTILVVKQNHRKPPSPPPPPILSGRDALCAGKGDLSSEEDDNEDQSHRFSRPENVKKVLESGAIPDASMIHFARKKRQKAREMGDFISVEDEEPEDTGRLVRDDDNEESDEERIEMDPNMVAKRDMEKRREQFLSAQECDKELDEWEDQQIRKGVTGPISLPPSTPIIIIEPQQNSKLAAPPTLPPDVPRTPQAIAEQLREHYRDICASKEFHIANLQEIELDLERAKTESEVLKKSAPEVAIRFRFYQELRGYITDLVEFMDDKINDITTLESRALKLMQAKATFLIERRRQDVRDEMGGDSQAEEEKVRRAAEREGRRSRRRRAREALEGNTVKHVEGLSSDEEMGVQDQLFFDKEQNDVEQEIFQEDEMFSISNILMRFDQWKNKDLLAYNEAYASLCLPKIIAPLIRLNLIFWNPLLCEIPLEKMHWYRPVALYGLKSEETESTLSADPDVSLLPILVEKILVPKLGTLVEKCWDPLSSSQTLSLVGTVKKLVRKFPTLTPESKSLTTLFNSIQHRIKQALDSDVFIPITLKMADSKHQQFFQRQFSSGLKLLKNIASWQGILNEKRLKELALTSLLNKYLLSALKFCNLTDACLKMRLISQVLPIVWLQDASVEFQMFKISIGNLQRQLDKNNPLHLESLDILSTLMRTLRQ